MFQGIPNIRNISDDIRVYGKTQAEHDRSLKAVFQRLQEKNLTLNEDKCEYNKAQIELYGNIFTKHSVSADAKKVAAIRNMLAPCIATSWAH